MRVNGQVINVPSNFPQYIITANNEPDDGYFFLAADKMPDKSPGWLIMIDNYGTPVYYRYFNKVLNSFEPQPNGLLSFMAKGNNVMYYLMDSTFTIVDSVKSKAPYSKTDAHDFMAMANGHYLFLANDPKSIDMTGYGGQNNATVTGSAIQEQDKNKNVVFNWSSWDHFKISDSYADMTVSSVDLIHSSSSTVDEDGNILVISRSLNEVTKINRQTGDIIWRLGGKNNQFTFTDTTSMFSMPHNFRKLPNGNFTIFDDGDMRNPPYSRALEYSIDQIKKVVNLVWSFDADKKVFSNNSGNTTRLKTGNTVVGYGYSVSNPAIIEVHPDSSIAFRLELPDNITSYKSVKSTWKNTLFQPVTNSIDFGKWDGYTSKIYLLIIKNNSNKVVTLTSYSTHSKAFAIEDAFPVDIPAKGQVILTVTYYPSTMQTGYIKDVLTINSDINTSSLVQRISAQINLSGTKEDKAAPVATIPLAGMKNVPQDTVIYINFNEPVRWINNTDFSYKNVDSLVILKKDNVAGENVSFDAVISTDKDKITIKPKLLLTHTQTYYIAVKNNFEDYSDNRGSFKEATFSTIDLTAPVASLTPTNGAINVDPASILTIKYNEPVRNLDNTELTNTEVTSLVTFKETDANGANVNFTATINTEKTTISVTSNAKLSNKTVYYFAIGAVVEDYSNNKAIGISSTFTTGIFADVNPGKPMKKIIVYPNPGNGLFRIQIPEEKGTRFKVIEITGKIIYDDSINGNNTYSIDLSSYPDGIYFLNIETEGHPSGQIFKLVKLHEL